MVLTDRGCVTLRDGAVVAEVPAVAGARRVKAALAKRLPELDVTF